MKPVWTRSLSRWEGKWRHEGLAITASREGDISVDDLARAIVDSVANPRSRYETFMGLIAGGAFKLAQTLLDAEKSRGLSLEQEEEMQAALEKHRTDSAERNTLRVAELRARARAADVETPDLGNFDELSRSSEREADELLDRASIVISEAERSKRDALTRALREHPVKDPDWRERAQQRIDDRRFGAAEAMIGSGLGQQTNVQDSVPRLQFWPYRHTYRDVADWVLDNRHAPPDFYTSWWSSPNSEAAMPVLVALRSADKAGVDASTAVRLATELDTMLGVANPQPEAQLVNSEVVEVRLHGIFDERIPFFSGVQDDGIPLWLPTTPDATPPEVPTDTPIVLWRQDSHIGNRSAFRDARGVVKIPMLTMIRVALAPDTARRSLIVREICRALSPAEAIRPSERFVSDEPPLLRDALVWLLDMLVVRVANPSVLDVLIHYSGGRYDLCLQLLSAVFAHESFERQQLTSVVVLQAARTEEFRDAVLEAIQSGVNGHALHQAILFLLAKLSDRPGAAVREADLLLFLEEEADCPTPPVDEAGPGALAQLERLKFVLQHDGPNGKEWCIPMNGLGTRILDLALRKSLQAHNMHSTGSRQVAPRE